MTRRLAAFLGHVGNQGVPLPRCVSRQTTAAIYGLSCLLFKAHRPNSARRCVGAAEVNLQVAAAPRGSSRLLAAPRGLELTFPVVHVR